jgi:ribosomal protein S18 acetylase RimI-like enzyme
MTEGLSQNCVVVRQMTPADEEFLCGVYAASRSAEFAVLGWDRVQLDAFLRVQFETQTRAYAMQSPNAETSVIEYEGVRTGRLIVDHDPAHTSLIDIAIAPEFRRNGIASTVIRQLQDEAAEAEHPIILNVDKSNGVAFGLYQKLGFEIVGETDLGFQMRWIP